MPIYDYRCKHCGDEREVFRMRCVHLEELCENCGGPMVVIPSAANFKINGFSEANGYAKKGDTI